MCTVTLVPLEYGDFIFTSNRDEQVGRTALPPQFYTEDGIKLLYPKDKKAGGTWVALSENDRLVCLLNGAYEGHVPTGNYKCSRGIIVKEILKADYVKQAIQDIDLEGVEPFTLITLDWSFLTICIELIWDGVKKDIRVLSQKPKIWSSSTLYSKPIQQERRDWFANFLSENELPTQEAILNFHLNENLGTKETSIKMKRSYVETTSVTSITKIDDFVYMYYQDVLTGETTTVKLN